MRRFPVLLSALAALLAVIPPGDAAEPSPEGTAQPLRVVLIGASIARRWQLAEFPARTGRSDVALEYVGEYGFDKSAAVDTVLARSGDRPDVVILKECGAYFPGDQPAYEALIGRWVEALRAAGIRPVLATVAPVAEPTGLSARLKELVKQWILRREDQNDAIAAYNNWVRRYAAEQRLALLDLEAAVDARMDERQLDPACDSGDGLHLNAEGYRRLDVALSALLDRLAVSPPDPE